MNRLPLLFFFALLSFLALYQPLFHASTHVTGASLSDYYHFHWSYWWLDHALGQNIYYSDYVLFPFENNLAYHTMAAFWYPLWKLVSLLGNSLAAMNWIFFVAMSLTGYSMFGLLRQEKVSLQWALLGGVALQCSPLLLRAIWWTNPNLIGIFWYPFSLLLWGKIAKYVREESYAKALGWAGILGAAFWAMILTDLQYGMFIPFLLLPYGLLTLWEARKSAGVLAGLGLIALLIGLGLAWVSGTLPALLAYEEGAILRADVANTWGIHFPSGYLWNAPDYWANPRVGGVATGAFILALGINLHRREPWHSRRWFWFALALIPLLLSFGAEVRGIPMPYRLYHAALGGLFRFPERFGTLFMIPALVFAGITFSSHRPKALWSGILLLLIFFNLRSFHPMAIQAPLPAYDFYAQMGAEPYEYLIIEAPTAGGSAIHWVGEAAHQAFQFYGATHGKKMINGHLTRIQTDHWWYLRTDDPLLSWLGQRRDLEPDLVLPQLSRMIFEAPVGYLILHQDAVGRTQGGNEDILAYLNSLPQLLCAPVVERDAVVFRTRWHPDGCSSNRIPPDYRLEMGQSGDEIFLGAGWHYPENIAGTSWRWMGKAPQAHLYLELPPADYEIRLQTQAFFADQPLRLSANGQDLGEIGIQADHLGEFSLILPQSAFTEGEHLTLTFSYDPPRENDGRFLSIAIDWLEFIALE